MKSFSIVQRQVGGDAPCYIIAELSCNHEGDFNAACALIAQAAAAGVDAVKIQTYRADTMTRDFNTKPQGTMWAEMDLYGLYQQAYTPWEWHGDLARIAEDHGLQFFSSPFDETAVDHLMAMNVPVIKVASFEVVDLQLLKKIAATGLPVILSNGMTTFLELQEAIQTLRQGGCREIAVTHCNSGYPAAFDEVNLATMPVIAAMFDVVVGLSDHTIFADDVNKAQPMAHIAPVEAVKCGAKIVEVHLIEDREQGRVLHEQGRGGFDWAFSREPAELKKMVRMIREYEATGEVKGLSAEETAAALRTHGQVCFEPTQKELHSRALRPSLWVVKDIQAGEPLQFAAQDKSGNFDSIRPGGGLPIRFAALIQGRRATRDLKAGQPLDWSMLAMSVYDTEC